LGSTLPPFFVKKEEPAILPTKEGRKRGDWGKEKTVTFFVSGKKRRERRRKSSRRRGTGAATGKDTLFLTEKKKGSVHV